MFNKLKRYYNQNRNKIWEIIGICAFIIILIQAANYFAGLNLKNKKTDRSNVIKESQLQSKSIISDTKISTETAKKNNEVIDEFVKFCNEGKIDSAYDMITQECKNAVYKTIEQFKKEYYDVIFSSEKLYTKENWYSDDNLVTYRVIYTNNILADGEKKSDETFGDYITTIKEDDETKLNIGQFIKFENINKKREENNLKIEILEKQVFRLYEMYKISFTNNSDSEITLYDTAVGSDSKWYVTDKGSTKYNVTIGEIAENLLKIQPGETKTLTAKFMKTYNPNKKTKEIYFENIICNNEKININMSCK